MQTIQEILNFSVGKLTVGNIIFAIAIFIVCHMVIKALMGPINKLLDKLSFDKTLRTFLQAAIRVILNFVAVCIVAESVGIPISSLLAVLGMFGLAVSLSVQQHQNHCEKHVRPLGETLSKVAKIFHKALPSLAKVAR